MTKQDVLQAGKFALVGVVNTLLDYVLFFVFFSLCNFDKNIAQILATAIAMTNSYLVNRYWTFQQTGGVKGQEIGRFIVVNILSLLTTLLFLNLFYDWLALHTLANQLLSFLNIPFMLLGDWAVMFCKVLVMPFSLGVNFLGNRLWVFKK